MNFRATEPKFGRSRYHPIMATDFFRRSFEVAAWSGNITHLQRILDIISKAFESEKSTVRKEAQRQADEDIASFSDMPEYRAGVEQRLERDLQKIDEAFNLRANIDEGKSKSKRIVTGSPQEIVERLDERVRQDLSVQCPGLGGTRHTRSEVSLSMTSKYGMSVQIEGEDEDWVLGVRDRLLEEATRQAPSDAWILGWWAKGSMGLATCIIVATISAFLPVSFGLRVAFGAGVGFGASMLVIELFDKVNRFELLAAGKKARSAKSGAVIASLVSSVVIPVLLYLITR